MSKASVRALPDLDADGMKIAASPSSMVTFAATVMLTRWPVDQVADGEDVCSEFGRSASCGYERRRTAARARRTKRRPSPTSRPIPMAIQ